MEVREFTENREIGRLVDRARTTGARKSVSDVVDAEGRQYVDLVMEGGGVLGIALVGFTYLLERAGIRFLGLGGTSVGSVNALLMAALGPPAEEKSPRLVELLAGLDLLQFVDGGDDAEDLAESLAGGSGLLGTAVDLLRAVDELVVELGVNPGDRFLEWLTDVLARHGIVTLSDLRRRLETPPLELRLRSDVEPLRPIAGELKLVTADVTTETKVELPGMAALYWDDPEAMSPALFARASMSIPFFFEPLWIDDVPRSDGARERWLELAGYDANRQAGIPERCALVDGGIMSNFPIDLFHVHDRVPAYPTFGVKLGRDERRHRIDSPVRLLGAVFGSARHTLDYDFIKRNPDYRHLVAWIDTGDHHWLDFAMGPEEKIDLFVRGCRAAAGLLDRFDWERYKGIRRRIVGVARAATR